MNFAKVFQVEPDEQILIYMTYNPDDEMYELHRIVDQEIFIDGIAGFKKIEDCQAAFDSYDDTKAKALFENLRSLSKQATE